VVNFSRSISRSIFCFSNSVSWLILSFISVSSFSLAFFLLPKIRLKNFLISFHAIPRIKITPTQKEISKPLSTFFNNCSSLASLVCRISSGIAWYSSFAFSCSCSNCSSLVFSSFSLVSNSAFFRSNSSAEILSLSLTNCSLCSVVWVIFSLTSATSASLCSNSSFFSRASFSSGVSFRKKRATGFLKKLVNFFWAWLAKLKTFFIPCQILLR
jgi:hypothetical protein